jgi:hypothetical protein
MVVYPAAGLVHYAPYDCIKYVVDPKLPDIPNIPCQGVRREGEYRNGEGEAGTHEPRLRCESGRRKKWLPEKKAILF